MSDRTFTLDEALSLLPVLESLLRNAIGGKKLMEEVEGEMQELSHRIFLNGGTHVDIVSVAQRKAERGKAEQRAKDALAEIDSIGVQVKDIDIGLLDFPCEVEGEIVLLCWKMGEKSITHWHGTSEGFAGRKLIERAHRTLQENALTGRTFPQPVRRIILITSRRRFLQVFTYRDPLEIRQTLQFQTTPGTPAYSNVGCLRVKKYFLGQTS